MSRISRIYIMVIMLSIPIAIGGDWVRPISEEGFTSYWTQTGNDIYYNTGSVGIGSTNPLTDLELKSTSGDSIFSINTISGSHDSTIAFYNQGTKEAEISMCDSAADEIKFIRGPLAPCTGKDIFSITSSGLEMGTAMFYYDSPTRWYRAPCCSSLGNNFFEFDDQLAPGQTLSTLSGGQQGQRITIICSETNSIVADETGNIDLTGDFDCAVVGVGSTLELMYFDDAQQPYEWHEVSRSIN